MPEIEDPSNKQPTSPTSVSNSSNVENSSSKAKQESQEPLARFKLLNQTGASIRQLDHRLAAEEALSLGKVEAGTLGKIKFDLTSEVSTVGSFNRENGFGTGGPSSAISVAAHIQNIKLPVTTFMGVAAGGMPTVAGQRPSVGSQSLQPTFFAGIQTDRSLIDKTFKFGKDDKNEVGVMETQASDYLVNGAGGTGNILSLRAKILKLQSFGTLGARFDLRSGALAENTDRSSFRLTYKTPEWLQEKFKSVRDKSLESVKSTLRNWFRKE